MNINNVVVTLLAQKPCELNRFLSAYYNKEMGVSDGAFRWSCICKEPLESVSILATLVDNIEKFKIEALLSIENYESIKVSEENINELVKFLYLIQ